VTLSGSTQPLEIVNLKANNVTSNDRCDGSILVEVSGGCCPYQYQLSGQKSLTNGSGCFTALGSGSYTVTVTDQRGATVAETVVIGVICFTRDSYVCTDQGVIRVDRLSPKNTIKKHPIELVCSGSIPVGGELIEVGVNAFGPGRPNRPLHLTPNHRISHQGKLVKAERLESTKMATKKVSKPVEVFNVLLPIHATIWVNGLEIESLHPDSVVAKQHRLGRFK
jgi:hypothetical protein